MPSFFPTISVITTTFNLIRNNREKFFIEMFESVHNQTYKNIEHVIIDGGSKDGTIEFIENVIAQKGKKTVKLISEPDKGITDATNKGVRHASGEYIILMCSDDYYVRQDALEILYSSILKNSADFACADCFWLFKTIWECDLDSFLYRHPFVINTLLIKKSVFEKTPFFNYTYKMVADYELMFRLLSQTSYKGVEVKKTLTCLRPGGFSQTQRDLFISETIRVYKKYLKVKGRLSDEDCLTLHYGTPTPTLLQKLKFDQKNTNILLSLDKLIKLQNYHNKTYHFVSYKLYRIYSLLRRFCRVGSFAFLRNDKDFKNNEHGPYSF